MRGDLKAVLTRPLGRGVLANLWAESLARFMTGFLTLFLAFVAKAQPDASALQQAGLLAIAGGAGGIGTFVGNAVGARIPLGKPGRIATIAAGSALSAAIVAAFLGTLWMAAVFALVAAVASALGKVALDSSIQADIPDAAVSSAFGRSETALQLAWVFGGALGVLLPPDFTIGFSVVTVVGALMFTQSLLTARGSTLVPGLGGNRPRYPGENRAPDAPSPSPSPTDADANANANAGTTILPTAGSPADDAPGAPTRRGPAAPSAPAATPHGVTPIPTTTTSSAEWNRDLQQRLRFICSAHPPDYVGNLGVDAHHVRRDLRRMAGLGIEVREAARDHRRHRPGFGLRPAVSRGRSGRQHLHQPRAGVRDPERVPVDRATGHRADQLAAVGDRAPRGRRARIHGLRQHRGRAADPG
ncbi:hypothetical protein ACFSSF_12195 [Dietzia aerolata]|uniref:hypothetical protein n=1 Tax=Dietzia aerolata TaxID=595984 RepID=UPI00362BB714